MSSSLETLAAKLAEDCLKAMKATGHERLYVELGNVIGASSQTLEEAFLTEVRIRLSDQAAREFLIRRVRELKDQGAPE
ncbi:hypothetical protein SAMN06297129_2358 [Pseudooceanicola antarcticus]|uniref:Uncharacterized protein n=1 Tax=Pseudooceanicola antarcticus TaxID=1247613 RepID=A0A285IX57_9RHOB|nr:hypothetical protein [Pseudooceanicola antarcticus]PJE25847.1 hypothetical protein CVM39_19285 [Pseudooceanicola antarcticus]SNY52625.1 hypothetical protein SAMN06297129_2358 [Pseudooceanicola antarcticus]